MPCFGVQLSTEQIGTLPGPMLPANVTGELDLTQSLTGGLDNGTAATRGYTTSPPGMPYFSNASQVRLALLTGYFPMLKAQTLSVQAHHAGLHLNCCPAMLLRMISSGSSQDCGYLMLGVYNLLPFIMYYNAA